MNLGFQQQDLRIQRPNLNKILLINLYLLND